MSESIGGYLARQRRLRGITLDDLAAATRIPRRSLERLEGGAFDDELDGFARGFVRTVAEALGLEPADTVNRMLPEPRSPAERARFGTRLRWLLAAAVLSALLLVPLLWVNLLSTPVGSPAEARASGDPELVLRRDPVRALAAAEGALAELPAPLPALEPVAVPPATSPEVARAAEEPR